MDIFELSRRSYVGLKTLRKIEKFGALIVDEPDPVLAPIKHYISRNKALTSEHMAALIERPELVEALEQHAPLAQSLIAELGAVEPAPAEVGWAILGAAANDPVDVATIVDWARSVLPARDVGHHWLAVRLLLAIEPAARPKEAKRLRRVMLNVRRSEAFAGWWRVVDGATFYRAPVLDL